MIESHFGFYEVDDGCAINLYYPDESGYIRRETVATIPNVTDAQELCDNLNRIIPLIKKQNETKLNACGTC
jgi:hypothetical protein